ncbi:inositol 1,4,5-trisphosphate receptor-interacting protein-like 1 [Passer domesticus]|uniref:inositol 1,4,5-trisphosphate receptor-interacting protein-like 1 n=1 Tax=Passer domesticus TaxID=48849 RepID=UPI0030FED9D2
MTWLMQGLEQKSLEQSGGEWGALLGWQLWAVLGILVLLLVLWFGLKKIRCHPDNSGQESSNSNLVEEEKVNNVVARKEVERNNGNVEEDHHQNVKNNLGSVSDELILFPVENLDQGCSMIIDRMGKLTEIFCQGLSNSFYLMPQESVRVGSAFEGWSPCARNAVYRVLVPLSPPPGHTFHLQLDTAGMPQRSFCVCVELLCTCMREQLGKDMLCFLHHPEEELRRKQKPSLLHTLRTGSYLNVEKTVQWFCHFVRVAWLLLPQSCHWHLMLQPSSRSCKFQLSKDKESLMAEMIFGVQQGDSDIFVGSQPSQVGMANTTWLETYTVVEAKFFRHNSRQAPPDSWHCKCLQLLAGSQTGAGFSSYALETVVMHLLSTVPLTQWRRKDLGQRLMDI